MYKLSSENIKLIRKCQYDMCSLLDIIKVIMNDAYNTGSEDGYDTGYNDGFMDGKERYEG